VPKYTIQPVSTGSFAEAEASLLYYARTPDQEPVAALRRLGLAPADVDVVINTHLHWDHCHSNHLFPKATIRVQADEIVEAMNPLPAHRGLYAPLHADPPWARVIQKTVPVKGDAEICPGVRVHALLLIAE